MLTVATWCWGAKYGTNYVARLRAGLARHLATPHRFAVVTDLPEWFDDQPCEVWPIPEADRHLLKIKGCFARLRMFDPAWQEQHSIAGDDTLACIDLDVIVTGPLDPVFDQPEPFTILQGANAANPCPYNGSLWMLQAGYRPDVWEAFSIEAAGRVPFYEFPDDQGWLAHRLPGAAGWQAGPTSGVYAFKKPGWPAGDGLPAGARLVCFPGRRDPSQFMHLGWVQEHWRLP